VVEGIAMTSGQSTKSSIYRDSTTASRLSPKPPERHAAPLAGAAPDGGRNFKPGRPKSLGHRSAVHWLQRGAVSEKSRPAGRGPRHQARSSRRRLAGRGRLFSAGPRGRTRPPTRSGRTAGSPYRPKATR